jgi:hypothetical protein
MSYPPRSDPGGELSSALLAILFIAIAAIVVIAVLAWSPWADENGVTPGLGGADTPTPQAQTPTPERTPSEMRTPTTNR